MKTGFSDRKQIKMKSVLTRKQILSDRKKGRHGLQTGILILSDMKTGFSNRKQIKTGASNRNIKLVSNNWERRLLTSDTKSKSNDKSIGGEKPPLPVIKETYLIINASLHQYE